MSSRNERVRLAEETVRISREGKYGASGLWYEIHAGAPQLLTEADLEKIQPKQGGTVPRVRVVDACVVETIRGLQGKKIGVLNFASAKNPGGGFLGGAMAQEEMLSYCSDLYASQMQEPAQEGFYKYHQKLHSQFYSDRCFLSENAVFRDSRFRLASPVQATFLTCAAVNQTIVKVRQEGQEAMRRRVHSVMKAFSTTHFDVLVLGAFGCGVFKNSPEVVADAFMEEIDAGNVDADEVLFCIKGQGKNLGAFQERCK